MEGEPGGGGEVSLSSACQHWVPELSFPHFKTNTATTTSLPIPTPCPVRVGRKSWQSEGGAKVRCMASHCVIWGSALMGWQSELVGCVPSSPCVYLPRYTPCFHGPHPQPHTPPYASAHTNAEPGLSLPPMQPSMRCGTGGGKGEKGNEARNRAFPLLQFSMRGAGEQGRYGMAVAK